MADPSNEELYQGSQRSIVHLELRDAYMLDDPYWQHWKVHRGFDAGDRSTWHDPYYDRMVAAIRRGVSVRRARIVSEPVSDYVRFEYALSAIHEAAGERVRYLARHDTIDLALPACDFWLFDDETLKITHFSGGGDVVRRELVQDVELVKFYSRSFETVWNRATPQRDYQLP